MWRSVALIVIVFIKTCASNAPNIDYSHNMRILKLPKSTKPGTIIYRLKGTDSDPEQLSFGIKGPTGLKLIDVVSVSFNEADVYLKSPLEENEYKITIYITDGRETTELESLIMVTEVEEPIKPPFVDFDPLFTISESAKHNETVGYIGVKERENSNLAVTFELRGTDKFSIRYVFGPKGTSKALISLVKPVDYEKQKLYFITVFALNAWTNETIDTRNVVTTKIVIAVEDVEDTPPRFDQFPSVIKISDDFENGTAVAAIRAEDGDYGIQRAIQYRIIAGDYSSFFTINQSSGDIFLLESFDELKKKVGIENPFLMTIEAREVNEDGNDVLEDTESTTATAQLSVLLISKTNNPPVFESRKLVGFIDENSPKMTVIRWRAESIPRVTDFDPGPNGTFTLTMEPIFDSFIIQPSNARNEVYFSLFSNEVFDFETNQSFTFTIIAKDDSSSPQMASIQCEINVVDLNDNIPQFSQSSYEIAFYENSPLDIDLLTVTASDADSENFGKIKYSLFGNSLSKNIEMNADTGVIKLISLENIDRETMAEYMMNVEVRDNLGFGNQNVTTVKVKILDANDNEPKFTQRRYDTMLNEDGSSFVNPVYVKAIDRDEPNTANSNVTYEIIAGNLADTFTINEITGEINVKRSLIEKNEHEKLVADGRSPKEIPNMKLTIRAHDQGIPYRYSSTELFIYNQNHINRSVIFLLNGGVVTYKHKWKELERNLSAISGADVHVLNIRSSSPEISKDQVEQTAVETRVVYPTESTVDLTKFAFLSTEAAKPSENRVNTASVMKSDYDTVFWILVLLVFITICFLILLLIILCIYCRPRRDKLSEMEKTTDSLHFTRSSDIISDKSFNESHLYAKQVESKHLKRHEKPKSRAMSAGDGVDNDSHDESSYSPDVRYQDKMKRWRSKRRITPEHLVHDKDALIRDVESGHYDGGYYVVHRNPHRKSKLSFKEMPTANGGGTFVVDAGEVGNYRRPIHAFRNQSEHHNPRKTEILYIRSPLHSIYNENVRSVSQNDMNCDDEECYIESEESTFAKRRGETNADHQRRQVSFSVAKEDAAMNGDDNSQKSLKFKHKRSVSQVTLSSRTLLEEPEAGADLETHVVESSRSSPPSSAHRKSTLSMVNVLPGSVDSDDSCFDQKNVQNDEAAKCLLPVGDVKTTDDKLLSHQLDANLAKNIEDEAKKDAKREQTSTSSACGIKSRDETSQPLSSQKLIDNVMSEQTKLKIGESSEKSDSDSGIGRSQVNKELQLKNSDLMAKRSIFTIAYDGVKTNRIRSADSCPSSP